MTEPAERMSGSLAGTPGSGREEAEPSTAGPALRLLLVEDDAHDVYAVRRALRKGGPDFEITHCTRAEDALERVASEAAAFDVALVDYGLPGMSGMELCDQLLGADVPFPLVMLTGTGTERLAVEALRSGIFDYVIKDPNAGYLALLPSTLAKAVQRHTDRVERRRAEAALGESEARLRTTLRSVVEGVATIDESGVIESFNPAAERMFGYAAEDVIGRNVNILMPEPDRGKHGGYIRRYLETGEARIICGTREVTGRRKDGTAFPLDLGIAEMRLGDRRFFVGTLRDITERKRAEAERERLEAQLRQAQKMEAVGTLAGGIAHDFNNILAGMTGYAHLAIDAVPAESQVHGDLEQILKSIDRAARLVRQILAFSRRSAAERHPIEIGRVVEEALQLLRASIPATIDIRWKIDREAGTVMADAAQLQQVMMNLCTNAVDAIGLGPGAIKVALAGVELGAADTATRPDLAPGSYVKLSVSDNGAGMDAATRARVFEPFFTTKEPGKGTGLGLAVAHGIVREHGGTIEVDSAPGRGTTMTVLLPRTEVAERGVARADRDIPRGHERILLVDDEAAIAHSEARLLERLGYRVEAATSSVRALEAFRAAPETFDLVITDQAMPELSGMALAREILKARGGIPIILRSGYTDALGTEEAEAIGIQEFLIKPIHPDDLARAVRRALDRDAKGGDEGHGTGSGNR